MEEHDSDFVYNPDVNYDEAIMAQQRDIEKTIIDTQPLIGPLEEISSLENEYLQDPVYFNKIKDLKTKYRQMRRTRGDGNCFFRAFAFAHLEQLISEKEEAARFQNSVIKGKEDLINLGFPSFTIEDFHDVFIDLLEQTRQPSYSIEQLLSYMNSQGESDYTVVYLRLLVSGYLQKEADFFANFMVGGLTVREFCTKEVEPMGRESDHIHIIALAAVANVPILVQYMDRGKDDQVISHAFPENSNPKIHLLYRPGHYDILYV